MARVRTLDDAVVDAWLSCAPRHLGGSYIAGTKARLRRP